MIYDAQFAHFMEMLTGKEPGMWAGDLKAACEYYRIDPDDFIDGVTEMRLGNPPYERKPKKDEE